MAPKKGNWLGALPGAALCRNPTVSPPATGLVSHWINLSDRLSSFVYARQPGKAPTRAQVACHGGEWPGGACRSPPPRGGRRIDSRVRRSQETSAMGGGVTWLEEGLNIESTQSIK